jgi:hypothetical protein
MDGALDGLGEMMLRVCAIKLIVDDAWDGSGSGRCGQVVR